MRTLWDSNELLGDREALDAAWERDGFWLLRDVLDKGAVKRLRAKYMQLLHDAKLVDQDSDKPVWNGADVKDFSIRLDPLADENAWKILAKDPAVEAFFTQILGGAPFWIPIVVYRANPPRERAGKRMDFVHQDGFYNEGIPFRTCWIPLERMDEPMGGLALAPGLHRSGYFHDTSKPPKFLVPPDAISEDKWARGDVGPGDIIIFDLGTPHTGLANYSDRFRLSMDIRVMPQSDEVPAIGAIAELDTDTIVVRGEDGDEKPFLINDDTYCRDAMGFRLEHETIEAHMHVGDQVIVAGKGGIATVVRPLSY